MGDVPNHDLTSGASQSSGKTTNEAYDDKHGHYEGSPADKLEPKVKPAAQPQGVPFKLGGK